MSSNLLAGNLAPPRHEIPHASVLLPTALSNEGINRESKALRFPVLSAQWRHSWHFDPSAPRPRDNSGKRTEFTIGVSLGINAHVIKLVLIIEQNFLRKLFTLATN